MNTPEFIRLKNENRYLRITTKKLCACADDYYDYASKKSKQIKYDLENSFSTKERRVLMETKHKLYMKYYDIIHKIAVIEDRIESNGHMLMKMKLAKKRNDV